MPFVGPLPGGGGHVFIRTGYNKWGMTNAVAAGLRICGHILGERPGWGKVMEHRVSRPADLVKTTKANASVGVAAALGWGNAAFSRPIEHVKKRAEGQAVRAREGVQPIGLSTVDGMTCAVSPVCPHLKGVLNWNDAERSWDCPLHGSRFSARGELLEGPATEDLARVDVP